MPVEARSISAHCPMPHGSASLTEDILEPDLPIVDPHHHLWDHPGNRYLLDELLADVNSAGTISSRLCSSNVAPGLSYRRARGHESDRRKRQFVASAMAEEGDRRGGDTTKICAGIVGHVDFAAAAECRCGAEGQHAAAGTGDFAGSGRSRRGTIRRSSASLATAARFGLMADPSFRSGLSLAGRPRLTFDAWSVSSADLDLARCGARISRQVTIVVNHFGGRSGSASTSATRCSPPTAGRECRQRRAARADVNSAGWR